MSSCNHCGNKVSASAWSCPSCGSQTPNLWVTIPKIIIVGFFGYVLLTLAL